MRAWIKITRQQIDMSVNSERNVLHGGAAVKWVGKHGIDSEITNVATGPGQNN